jgi:hypothetical protein
MTKDDRRRAFEILLSQSLSLPQGSELVVIYDSSFDSNLESLQIAAQAGRIALTMIRLPFEQQLRLVDQVEKGDSDNVQLPRGLAGAMSAADGILNVLSSAPETTVVRRAIVNHERGSNCRLAHIPGISDAILGLVLRTNLVELNRACERMAYAIGNSEEAVVESRDSIGRSHFLKVRLRGWDSEPIISSGAIPPGSWGNAPGGETFCCPPSKGVEGDICINGSVPNYCLQTGEELLLRFRGGRLISWEANPSPATRFLEKEQEKARRADDGNWNVFAELGVGLNPAIEKLTGNSLFDEKAGGTIHIAIGDNFGFGHDISAKVHHDMVTQNADLKLDGRIIIANGKLCQVDVVPDMPASAFKPLPNATGKVIYVRDSRYELVDHAFTRRLASAYRTGFVQIASGPLATALNSLCEELITHKFVLPTDFLREHPMHGEMPTVDLLRLLYHYRIVVYK